MNTVRCTHCHATKSVWEFYEREGHPYQPCKSCCLKRSAAYYKANRAIIAERKRKYNKTLRRRGIHTSSRYLKTPKYREENRCRSCLRRSFLSKGKKDSLLIYVLCGIPAADLYSHLCQTWEKRYGAPYRGEPAHIDHIIPLSSAKEIPDMFKLFRWENLQLLTPADNQAKGTKE